MDKKTKLERLIAQREKINARIQMAEAKEKTAERKKDTRRKILIGAYYLDKAKKDETFNQEVTSLLDGFLKKETDRELFGLNRTGENDGEKV